MHARSNAQVSQAGGASRFLPLRLTLDQLRVFVAVAEHLHVTRAANALGISQSGASAAIAALEIRHGLKLFHRIGRRIVLTDAGQTFVPAARAALDRVLDAQRSLSELSLQTRSRLSVCASETIASYWLPTRLGEFRRRHPTIQVQVKLGSELQVAAAVLDGMADLGFTDCQVDADLLQQDELPGDELVLICADGATHALSAHGRANLIDLRGAPWVVRERGSGTRSAFDQAWRELDIDPETLNIILELPSNEGVLAAVESGVGSTITSSLLVSRTALSPIDIGLRPRPFTLLRHPERHVSRAQKALLEMIQP